MLQRKLANEEGVEPDKLHCIGGWSLCRLAHNNVRATTHTVFAFNVRTELAENLPHQVVGKLMPSQLAKVAASGAEADVLVQLRKTQDRTGSNSL